MSQTINLTNITKYAGSRELLSGVTLRLNPGEKYGLIGPNGCGKTTLLNVISGCDPEFNGDIRCSSPLVTGYVTQHQDFPPTATVREIFLLPYCDLINRLRIAEDRLAQTGNGEPETKLALYAQARDAYDQAGVDNIIARLENTLDALGLTGKADQSAATLSGGEKNILCLALALVKQPHLLILDEPGNHLDFAGLAWLEEFLNTFKQTVLIVSHNRFLLDRVCTHIIEIENCQTFVYTGNYSSFRMQKLKKQTSQQADYAANQRRLLQLENLVKRFAEFARRTADPAWGKRLRARKTQLKREKEQATENPLQTEKIIKLALAAAPPRAKIALSLRNYNKTFGALSLFREAALEISCGEKVGLIGVNGSGKTSLLRDIVQQGDWNHPQIRIGPSQQVGYLAQNPDFFRPQDTLETEIRNLGPLSRDDAYQLLARFLFTWQDLEKTIACLSGGELNRLQLARLIYLQPNFLILDEPTNHLDIPSREAVEDALCSFQGTVLVVSHDRYFLDKVTDRIVEIRDCRLVEYQGSFTEFWLETFGSKQVTGGKLATRGAERKRLRQPQSGPGPGKLQRLTELEGMLTVAEGEKLQLEKRITAVFNQGNHQEGRKLSSQLEKLVQRIEKLYNEWEGLS